MAVNRLSLIDEELKRRGIAVAADNPRVNLIDEELKTRGVDVNKTSAAPSMSRLIGEQLTQGTLSLADLMNALGRSHPATMTMPEEELSAIQGIQKTPSAAFEQYGPDINTQPLNTPGKRIAGHALRAIPSGVLAGVPGVLMGAGAGAASGLMQEAGMNPLLAEVASIPFAAGASRIPGMLAAKSISPLSGAERKVGRILEKFAGEENIPQVLKNIENAPLYKTGYVPSTSEIAENPGLASLARAQYEVPGSGLPQHAAEQAGKIEASLKDLSKGNISDTQEHVAKNLNKLNTRTNQALESIAKQATGEESGEAIQQSLLKELSGRKSVRSSETKPLYEKLYEIQTGIPTPNANSFLSKELKTAKGNQRKALEEAEKLIQPNKGEGLELSQSFLNAHPEFAFKNNASPAELKEALTEISERITAANRIGHTQTAARLRGLKKNLLEDLNQVPEEMAARTKYAELSEPVNAIQKHPVMGKIVKKEPTEYMSKKLIMSESRVPEQFLKKSEGSIDDAKAFLKEVGHDKEMLEVVKNDLNRRASLSILNKETGRVEPRKVESFINNHPAIAVLYPELATIKLKNIQNAQSMANRYFRDAEKIASTLRKDELGKYVPGPAQGLAPKIYNAKSQENISYLLKSIGDDIPAKEGLREMTIDHMLKSISNAGAEGKGSVLSHAKMNRFMTMHRKSLKPLFEPEQLALVDEVSNILKGQNYYKTSGASMGSPTAARKIIDEEIGKGITIGPEKFKKFINFFHNMGAEKTKDILHKSLIDSKIAKKILEGNFKGQSGFEKYLQDVSRMSVPLVKYKSKGEEE